MVDGVGIVAILLFVIVKLGTANGPAVGTVVAFGPPTVHDAEVGNAVERCFHAAGAAGLTRPAGGVEPYVHPLLEVTRQVHVIIFDKGHPTTQLVVFCQIIDVLNQHLARLIGRVCLPSKDNLHGAVDI